MKKILLLLICFLLIGCNTLKEAYHNGQDAVLQTVIDDANYQLSHPYDA